MIDDNALYQKKSDEEIVTMVKDGDSLAQEYLMNKYKTLVKSKARAYFLIGADREDIIQEGMIGLYKAVRDYQNDKNTTFKSFAELCVNRQMITAIKTATRQKHIPLNYSISLNRPVFDDDSEETYMDLIKESRVTSPEALLIGQEDKNLIETGISEILSDFETRTLGYYLQGKTYYEIAAILHKPEKSIDNALQRVKKKIEKFVERKRLED